MATDEVIEEAFKLKISRTEKAKQFLTDCGSQALSDKISGNETKAPSRQWINGVLENLKSQMEMRRSIDPKRLEVCSFE